jgi:hypothetical protein
MSGDGILSGRIDLDGPRRGRNAPPRPVEARPGLALVERATGARVTLVRYAEPMVEVRDVLGGMRRIRHQPGGFAIDGTPVTLTPHRSPAAGGASVTASGSVVGPRRPARMARAGRLLVEGVHDAELVERVWGDDLRHEGVVVECLDGMDDLAAQVAAYRPGPGRRLGVLLDHVVSGSKETRAARAVAGDAHVLVAGHPYVDVWAAVKPAAIGIAAWPEVPRGTAWKDGVLAALGVDEEPGRFWRRVLASVGDWRDLETPLVNAVERLIDFVTEPA